MRSSAGRTPVIECGEIQQVANGNLSWIDAPGVCLIPCLTVCTARSLLKRWHEAELTVVDMSGALQ